MTVQILHGTIVYADIDCFHVHENSYLIAEGERVKKILPVLPEQYEGIQVQDYGDALIIPAFSDLHVHASQYIQRGIGMDCLLEEWLNKYTFPQEAQFKDPAYAENIYEQFVNDQIKKGTFHSVIFTTIHRKGADILFDKLKSKGLSAYVGKVNMDTASPEYLCETTDESLQETEAYLAEHVGEENVKPILTPRFAPTCSHALMQGLGKLSKKYHVGLQTHLVESEWEAAQAVKCFPECSCDAEIYERAGLLEEGPIIFAHVIFPSEKDIALLQKHHCYAVHCPDATANVIAGITPASMLQERGIPVAIGTDVGASGNVAVYQQIARAVQFSKLKELYEPAVSHTISFANAFYMATKASGNLFGKTGSLEPGYKLDALVIDHLNDAGIQMTPLEKLERFCYSGDERNIIARYLSGKKLDLIN